MSDFITSIPNQAIKTNRGCDATLSLQWKQRTEQCWIFWYWVLLKYLLKCLDFPHSLTRQLDIIVPLSFSSAKYHILRLLDLKLARSRTSLQQLNGYLLAVSHLVLHDRDCTFIFDAFSLIRFFLCNGTYLLKLVLWALLRKFKTCYYETRRVGNRSEAAGEDEKNQFGPSSLSDKVRHGKCGCFQASFFLQDLNNN